MFHKTLNLVHQMSQKTLKATFLTFSAAIQARIAHPADIGSILAWYRGGPGFKSRQGRNFSVKISNWII